MKQLIILMSMGVLLSGCVMPAANQTLPVKSVRPAARLKPIKQSHHHAVTKTQERVPVVNLMAGKGERDA